MMLFVSLVLLNKSLQLLQGALGSGALLGGGLRPPTVLLNGFQSGLALRI